MNQYFPNCISSLIKCEYNIKISVYFDSFINKKLKIIILLLIKIYYCYFFF